MLRASFGTGFRVVNVFTEDHAALTGSRQVVIKENLSPERSVNGMLDWVLKFPGHKHYFGLDLSVFYTHFSNQITGDFDTDPTKIIYANLKGDAVSRGLSINVEDRIGQVLRGYVGASYMDVFRMEDDGSGALIRREQLHAPRWSGTFTISATLPRQWTLDLSGQWNGPMRLPVQPEDPRPAYSQWFALLNVQATRKLAHHIEIYGGLKNILDFVPKYSLMRPFDPFNKHVDDPMNDPHGYTFDTAYNYAPLQGIRGFLGMRWALP